jgi:hypothetical protein
LYYGHPARRPPGAGGPLARGRAPAARGEGGRHRRRIGKAQLGRIYSDSGLARLGGWNGELPAVTPKTKSERMGQARIMPGRCRVHGPEAVALRGNLSTQYDTWKAKNANSAPMTMLCVASLRNSLSTVRPGRTDPARRLLPPTNMHAASFSQRSGISGAELADAPWSTARIHHACPTTNSRATTCVAMLGR